MWLSLVERYVRDVEAASSNLVTPINEKRYPMDTFFVNQYDAYSPFSQHISDAIGTNKKLLVDENMTQEYDEMRF